MGVEVVEAVTPVTARLEPFEGLSTPTVDLDPSAAGYTLPAAADSVYPAINRLLAEGHEVYRLAAAHASGDRGDVYVPARRDSRALLQGLVEELRLPINPVDVEPTEAMVAVRPSRVGLFKPWVASMDEGWTRFVLQQYGFPMVNLANNDIRSGSFGEQVDVILFPDISPSIITDGTPTPGSWRARSWSPLPPEYAGGIDTRADDKQDRPDGSERIKRWVENGGTVVALDSSSDYLIDLFELPVANVLDGVPQTRFNCPGSSLRVLTDTGNPLTWGMRPEEVVYFADSPAFRTRVPDARFDRTVLARYPADDEDILVSGFLEGGDLLERRAAAVEFEVGEGRVILIGFRAQHRAQPLRTFKLLFNTLYDLVPTSG
jgi:hypothetical protein